MTAEEAECRTLLPDDGQKIQHAMEAYLGSDEAAQEHSAQDLEAASRYTGPPQLVRMGGEDTPKVGDFFVYLGEFETELRLQNTVAMSEQGRWGFSFNLVQRGHEWVVASFGTWRAWQKRE